MNITFGYVYIYILGVLSILSACTIIIMPILLSQVMSRKKKFYTSLLFSTGFSLSFAILGAITGYIGQTIVGIYEPYFIIFGIIVTFIMALKFFGLLKFNIKFNIPFLFKGSPLIVGFIFGFVGLSCISPLLSAVFVFAVSQKSIIASIFTFLIYSFGYVTPLIASTTILEEHRIILFMNRHREKVDFLSGMLLLFASSYLTLLYFGIILFT